MSAKVTDRKGRWRNLTIAFRASPQENEQINEFVRLCGISKQQYLINNMLKKDVIVKGNPRVFKTLQSEMTRIIKQLYRIRDSTELSEEQLEHIKDITELYLKLMNKDSNSDMQE